MNRTRLFAGLCLVLVVFISSVQASGTWTVKNPMPTPRYVLGVASVGDKIYAVGGYTSANNIHGREVVEEYNTLTDSWTTKTSLPSARWGLEAASVNGAVYAIGGATGTSVSDGTITDVEKYDPVANTWTAKAPMPYARAIFASAVLDGKIYAFAGHNGQQYVAATAIYDPVLDAWTTGASIPTLRESPAAASVNGTIYVVGGVGVSGQRLSTVEEYNPVTNTWTTKAPMPTARSGLGAVAINGIVYTFGGYTASTNVVNTVERYDPGTDSWTTDSPMPTARGSLGVASVGESAYAIGGTGATSESDSSANEKLTLNQPPVAHAGPDQTVPANGSCLSVVTLNGTGSFDPDGDTITYTWTGSFGIVTGAEPIVTLPLGMHAITLNVSDGNKSSTDEVLITVVDTTAPVIGCALATPNILMPPDHRMVNVTVFASATDNCAATPVCSIQDVISSEPQSGLGAGDLFPDIDMIDLLNVFLRAERSDTGNGRVYLITVECSDDAENTATQTVFVSVPRQQSNKCK